MIELQFFGAFTLTVDGRPVQLPTAKTRALLAYLILEPRPHSRQALARLFWPDQSDVRALRNLSDAWAALRTAFGSADGRLIGDTQTLQCDSSGLTFDVGQFDRVAAQLRGHPHRRAESCPACARSALQLVGVRSALLEGLQIRGCDEFNEWLDAQRAWRRRVLIEAQVLVGRAALRRGDAAGAVEQLELVAQSEPWDEAVLREYARALTLSSRSRQALREIERYRRRLQQELAVAPEAATEALTAQIRQQQLRVVPLSPQPPRMIGRDQELLQVLSEVTGRDRRLVTISGPGGVGKTLLAQWVAAEAGPVFTDGMVFVSLIEATDHDSVLREVGTACGVRFSGGRPLLDQLTAWLERRDMLLVLDNCEQAAQLPTLVGQLLDRTQLPVFLTTSRRRLGLRVERCIDLRGLSWDAGAGSTAVTLFLQSALDIGRQVAAADYGTVVQICRQLGGLPLAIDFAARRLRSSSPAEVAAEVDRPLDLGDDRMLDLPARQRRLVTILAETWQQLLPSEQELALRLALLHAPASRALLVALTADAAMTEQGLSGLLESAVVEQSADGRWTLHPLLRSFVQQQTTDERAADVRRRTARFFLAWLDDDRLQYNDHAGRAAAAQPAERFADIRSSWEWAVAHEPQSCRQPRLTALSLLAKTYGWYGEIARLQRAAAIALTARGSPEAAAAAWLAAGFSAAAASEWLLVEECRLQAAAGSDDSSTQALAAALAAWQLTVRGDHLTAQQLLEPWLNRPGLSTQAVGRVQLYAAGAAMVAADLQAAQASGERALRVFEQERDDVAQLDALIVLAQLPARAGDYAATLPLLEDVLTVARRVGEPRALAAAVGNVLAIRAMLNVQIEQLAPLATEALQLARGLPRGGLTAHVFQAVALAQLVLHEYGAVRLTLHEGLQIASQLNPGPILLELLDGYARLALAEGRPAEAAAIAGVVAADPLCRPFLRERCRSLLTVPSSEVEAVHQRGLPRERRPLVDWLLLRG